MADADTVMGEMSNNGDAIRMYEGATPNQFDGAGLRTGSLRYMIKKLVWDVLRFQKPADFLGWVFDPNAAVGLRDSHSRLYVLTVQNNAMLRKLCDKQGVDYKSLPGFPSGGGQS